jgi:Protein of unknown function (DUF3433)
LNECSSRGYREYFLFCSRNATSSSILFQGYNEYDKYYFTGQVCRTSYLAANVPINISTSSSGSVASFDQSTFDKAQGVIDSAYLNISDFEDGYIRQTGSNHLRPDLGTGFMLSNTKQNSNFQGPALVLAAKNNYSISHIMQMDPNELSRQAGTIKQQFLGEVLLSSFSDLTRATNLITKPFEASVTLQKPRLVADLGIGITMGIFLLLLAVAAAGLAFLTRLSKRPLELLRDPNKASAAALILHETNASACFKNLDKANPSEMDTALQEHFFLMRRGKLIQVDDNHAEGTQVHANQEDDDQPQDSPGDDNPADRNSTNDDNLSIRTSSITTLDDSKPKHSWLFCGTALSNKSDRDWLPFIFWKRAGTMLVLFLLAIIAVLIAVYAVSRVRPLYQSAFVYESDVKIGNTKIMSLAPYSIFPTLLAVIIKLWWSSIDDTYRRLTPFLAMANQSSTPKASSGASLSYITTPILWISILALRKGHWLLAIISFGALTSEVLQVSMAALWTREPGVLKMDFSLTKEFELRSIPHIFDDFQPMYRSRASIAFPKISQHLYGGELYQTSWEFGSLAQLAFGASPPSWSKDGWSFPPFDVSSVPKLLPRLPSVDDTASLTSSLNVTFDSQALRGRIECVPINNSSRWVFEVSDLSNSTNWHPAASGDDLCFGYELSSEVRVVVLPQYNGPQPKSILISQWLHFNYSSDPKRGDPLYRPTNSQNFTTLWINASYPHLYYNYKDEEYNNVFKAPPRLIFTERPQVQALNCRPIFETSQARIIVNANSSKIENFTLLEPPKADKNAFNEIFQIHYSNETAYYESGYNMDLDRIMTFNTSVRYESTHCSKRFRHVC